MTQTPSQNLERSDAEKRIDQFIAQLARYEKQQDRASLAALRTGLRSIGQDAAQPAAMHPHVVPFLDERPHHSDRWFYLVGALFAWHPAQARNQSLGAAFRALKSKDGASDSTEKRFAALLASDERDLHLHLRQAIGLLRANEVAIDWRTLLRNLVLGGGWNRANCFVQTQWARDYYRAPSSRSEDNPELNEMRTLPAV